MAKTFEGWREVKLEDIKEGDFVGRAYPALMRTLKKKIEILEDGVFEGEIERHKNNTVVRYRIRWGQRGNQTFMCCIGLVSSLIWLIKDESSSVVL
jgi:hypothetical protein